MGTAQSKVKACYLKNFQLLYKPLNNAVGYNFDC